MVVYFASLLISLSLHLLLILPTFLILWPSDPPSPSALLASLTQNQLGEKDSTSLDFSLPIASTNQLIAADYSKLYVNYQDFIDINLPVNVSIYFRPPQGVNFDELNTSDLVFHQFHKSVHYSYLKSLIQSYLKLKKNNPGFLGDTPHTRRVDGVISFSTLGKNSNFIILSSMEDDLEQLHKETLKNITNIEKPPYSLLSAHGIDIYYSLSVEI
jgi:hypothetical protein